MLVKKPFKKGLSNSSAALIKASGGGSSFTGAGDVVSGASAWWGLRAYSAATIGGNCVDIIRASDSTTQTFVTLANGSVDLASITTFLTATTGKVSKLYDQTGNGKHISQGSSVLQPTLTLNAVGSLPGITFDNAQNYQLLSTTTYTASQPLTLMAAAKADAAGSSLRTIIGLENKILLASDSTATLVEIDAGLNLFFFSLTPSTFYGYGGMVNGASSKVAWDGTNTSTGNAGTNAPSSTKFEMGYDTGGILGNAFAGVILEAGIWPTDQSANFAAMNSNQKTYWGF